MSDNEAWETKLDRCQKDWQARYDARLSQLLFALGMPEKVEGKDSDSNLHDYHTPDPILPGARSLKADFQNELEEEAWIKKEYERMMAAAQKETGQQG